MVTQSCAPTRPSGEQSALADVDSVPNEWASSVTSPPQPTPHAQHQNDPPGPEHARPYRGSGADREVARRSGPKHATARRWSWDALAHRGFPLYFAGSVVSNLGTWLQNTAQALLAYQLTHSVLAIGAVVCAQFSCVLVLGPLAGTVVSRTRSVRKLLVLTQVGSAAAALVMATLQFAGHLTEVGLICGALGLGLAYCFTLPATAVLLPAFVPKQQSDLETQREIRAVVALDAASYNIGRCVAPLLAVLVVTRTGFGWAFALNAASFLVLAVVFALVRPCSDVHPNSQAKVLDGFRVLSRYRKVRHLLGIVAVVTITADPVLVLGPALARHFGLPEAWAAYFLSALGGGTILGSFVPMRPPSKVRHAAYPLFLLGASVTVFALGFSPAWSMGAAFVAGVSCLLTNSTARALLVAFIPEEDRELQGPAVMAIWAIAWAGSKPLASLIDGVLATSIGAWVASALPGVVKVPSVQATGVLLAIPALIPALIPAVMPRPLRSERSFERNDWFFEN